MDECESLHGFGIEMSLENWKFSQVPTHRSVQASEASESKSILATIDLEKAGPPL